MTSFLLNVLFALVWAALLGSWGLPEIVVGFLLGYVVLGGAGRLFGEPRYGRKLPQAISLTLFFLWELLVSSLRVTWEVVTPQKLRRAGIVAVPLDAKTDLEIALLANLVTLTPGTLSLDVSSDRATLFVHAMFAEDPDEVRRDVKEGFERRLLELLR